MRGWKPVERTVNTGNSLAEAQKRLENDGFVRYFGNTEHVILKRDGKKFTLNGRKVPVEVAMSNTEDGIFVRVRYDITVWFDTGDLRKLTDNMAAKISGHEEDLR